MNRIQYRSMNAIQYRIATLPNYRGEWAFVIKKYMRVTFKRSKREGWHCQGFVALDCPSDRFETRAAALAAAKAAKAKLEAR